MATKKTRTRRRLGPEPRLPISQEAQYRALLRARLSAIHRRIEAAVAPTLLELRQDSFSEDWRRLKAQLREAFGLPTRQSLERIAKDVDTFNYRDLQRLALEVPPELGALRRGFVDRNVELITTIEADLLEEVFEIVTTAQEEGARAETVSKRLQERFGVSRSRADLIARDQVLKLNSDLTQVRHEEVGITRYVWGASNDGRTRKEHRDLNGTEHAWNEPPVVDRRTGRRDHPGRDFQCRCVAIPVLPDLTETKPKSKPKPKPKPRPAPAPTPVALPKRAPAPKGPDILAGVEDHSVTQLKAHFEEHARGPAKPMEAVVKREVDILHAALQTAQDGPEQKAAAEKQGRKLRQAIRLWIHRKLGHRSADLDKSRQGAGSFKVADRGEYVLAVHNFTGDVELGTASLRNSVGELLHTLVHEEIHGSSAYSSQAVAWYRSDPDIFWQMSGLEEVGTELQTRLLISGQSKSYQEIIDMVLTIFPVGEKKLGQAFTDVWRSGVAPSPDVLIPALAKRLPSPLTITERQRVVERIGEYMKSAAS